MTTETELLIKTLQERDGAYNRIAELEASLREWQAWEGSIITDERCWAPSGMAATPTIQQDQLDALTPIQERRERLLEEAKP